MAAMGGERGEAALGSARDGPRDIEGGGEAVGARGGPTVELEPTGFQANEGDIEPAEIAGVKPLKLRGRMARSIGFGAGKFTHQGDEVALRRGEQRANVNGAGAVAQVGFRGAKRSIQLVESAHRLDLRVILGYALTVKEARGTVVSGPGCNGA